MFFPVQLNLISSHLAFLILTLILLAFDPIFGQQNPTITFISKEKVVNIGDTTELLCTVQYAREYPVVWIRVNRDNPNQYLFISRGTSVLVPESRYSVKYDERKLTNVLTISKVQEIDAGTYSCEIITGSSSKVTAEVEVYVRIPPIISDNSTRSVITTVGANVSLHCYAFGYPLPLISWRRDKNDLLPNGMAYYRGNILNIPHVRKDDRGTYYCVADNGISPGARRQVGVEVNFPPQIRVGRGRYGQALQYDADLYCHIEAFPSPAVIWMKDGVQLSDNQHYQISIFATSNEFMDTTLRVKRIEKKQYGSYVCRAINKLGDDQGNITLFETVNVICPPACGIDLQYISGSISGTTTISSILIVFAISSYLYVSMAGSFGT